MKGFVIDKLVNFEFDIVITRKRPFFIFCSPSSRSPFALSLLLLDSFCVNSAVGPSNRILKKRFADRYRSERVSGNGSTARVCRSLLIAKLPVPVESVCLRNVMQNHGGDFHNPQEVDYSL